MTPKGLKGPGSFILPNHRYPPTHAHLSSPYDAGEQLNLAPLNRASWLVSPDFCSSDSARAGPSGTAARVVPAARAVKPANSKVMTDFMALSSSFENSVSVARLSRAPSPWAINCAVGCSVADSVWLGTRSSRQRGLRALIGDAVGAASNSEGRSVIRHRAKQLWSIPDGSPKCKLQTYEPGVLRESQNVIAGAFTMLSDRRHRIDHSTIANATCALGDHLHRALSG